MCEINIKKKIKKNILRKVVFRPIGVLFSFISSFPIIIYCDGKENWFRYKVAKKSDEKFKTS